MAGSEVDINAIYTLGNAWIKLGNDLKAGADQMNTARTATWTGDGADAAVWAFTALYMDVLDPAWTTCWTMGDAINDYGRALEQIEAKEQAAKNAAELAGAIASIIGLFLPFGLGSLGELVGPLLEGLTESLSDIIAGLSEGMQVVLKLVTFLGEVAGAGAGQLAIDALSQWIADEAFHVPFKMDWSAEAVSLGVAGGFGALGGAMGLFGGKGAKGGPDVNPRSGDGANPGTGDLTGAGEIPEPHLPGAPPPYEAPSVGEGGGPFGGPGPKPVDPVLTEPLPGGRVPVEPPPGGPVISRDPLGSGAHGENPPAPSAESLDPAPAGATPSPGPALREGGQPGLSGPGGEGTSRSAVPGAGSHETETPPTAVEGAHTPATPGTPGATRAATGVPSRDAAAEATGGSSGSGNQEYRSSFGKKTAGTPRTTVTGPSEGPGTASRLDVGRQGLTDSAGTVRTSVPEGTTRPVGRGSGRPVAEDTSTVNSAKQSENRLSGSAENASTETGGEAGGERGVDGQQTSSSAKGLGEKSTAADESGRTAVSASSRKADADAFAEGRTKRPASGGEKGKTTGGERVPGRRVGSATEKDEGPVTAEEQAAGDHETRTTVDGRMRGAATSDPAEPAVGGRPSSASAGTGRTENGDPSRSGDGGEGASGAGVKAGESVAGEGVSPGRGRRVGDPSRSGEDGNGSSGVGGKANEPAAAKGEFPGKDGRVGDGDGTSSGLGRVRSDPPRAAETSGRADAAEGGTARETSHSAANRRTTSASARPAPPGTLFAPEGFVEALMD